jgi:hypothetical protein
MQTGSSGTLIGWESDQTTFVPLWDRIWTELRDRGYTDSVPLLFPLTFERIVVV